jgi:Transglutaminase-like superfamily/Domain of Unknown Function with PDB structure (DUF3857)
MIKRLCLLSIFFACPFFMFFLAAQSNLKYGDITAKQFKVNSYNVDTSAGAVYLFDVGSCYYDGNHVNNLRLIYTRHTRIHLLNKKSFNLATVEIPLYQDGTYREEIENFKATTYNLQNGKIETTDIDRNAVFKDNSGNITIRKFTFPAVQEGSIIEFSYRIITPSFQSLRSWFFQGNYPKLWSEYKVSIPDFYDFAILKQGYHPFTTDSLNMTFDNYIFSDGLLQTATTNYTWAAEKIPALKEEAFTTTLANHVCKVEFQLSAIKFPNTTVKTVLRDWYETGELLANDEDFGAPLKHANNWLDADVSSITKDAATDIEKAKKIFDYVKTKFVCTGKNAVMLSQSLKQTYQSGKGQVADINILLAAMLKNAGIKVFSILLSTRTHGKAYDAYPIMSKYNYVVTGATIDGKTCLLDASDPVLGFNVLPGECYNGYARIIDKQPSVIDLSADGLSEVKQTTVFITGDKEEINASVSATFGAIESQAIRSKLKVIKENDYFKELGTRNPTEMKFSNPEIEFLNEPDMPLKINYDLILSPGDEKILYINPVLSKVFSDNPFKQSERLYPIEMPYCMDDIYILNMEIPKGYAIEEMPKSSRVVLNGNEGLFEYIIGQSNGSIQLRSRITLKKANFDAVDYKSLKDFFALIIKKQNEQIVLRKQ